MCVETSRLCHLSLYCLAAAHPPHFPPWWHWSWTWGRFLLCQLTSGKRKGFSVRCALASLLALRRGREHAECPRTCAPVRLSLSSLQVDSRSLAGTQQAAFHRRATAACLNVPQGELTGRHPARWAGTLGGFLASSIATSVGSIPLGPACSTSRTHLPWYQWTTRHALSKGMTLSFGARRGAVPSQSDPASVLEEAAAPCVCHSCILYWFSFPLSS